MHYYQFTIGDYTRHTTHLTLMENLAYRLLLDRYYLNELPLELDIKNLARRIGMSAEIESVKQVLEDFFVETENGYVNSRCDKEVEAYKAKADTARVNGKKGGRPKKADNNPEETQPVILDNPEETGLKANHKPLTTNHKPLTNNHKPITNTKSIVEAKPQRVDHVQPIFDYWVETMGKTAANKLTAGRRKCISARLKEGYTVDQIKLAITGCARSPHHMGQNSEGTIYDDITLICRNGENIERFSQNIAKVIPNATHQPSSQPAVNSNDTSWADEIINASEQECSSSGEQDFQRLESDSFGMEAGSFIGFDGGRH